MAEGDQVAGNTALRGWAALSWRDGLRTSVAAGFIVIILVGFDLRYPVTLAGQGDWLFVVGLMTVSYLGLCWSRGAALWRQFRTTKRSKVERRDTPNPFVELFIYLLIALGLLILASLGGGATWPWSVDLKVVSNISIYMGLTFLAFLPLGLGFRTHARYTRPGGDIPNHISNESLLLALLLIGVVGGLAWAAGEGKIQMAGSFGPVIMLLVLCLFLMFIAVPYVHSYLLGRSQVRAELLEGTARQGVSLANPATMISWFDTFLVRHIAPLTGATQVSRFVALPHLLLIAIFVPLTIMGYVLPAPFGLLPIGFALLLSVSLGRRWAWVENDRDIAMRLQSTREKTIQIGFQNDLRDEALLGYLFLFLLVPLALRQMQMWAAPFGEAAHSASLIDWAGFFGTELAKAVPIVDWADIYGIQANLPEFKTDNRFPRHLIFVARLMVDLVVIAALLQAFSIMQRNASQMQLYKDGQLDLLDPFMEHTHFRRGIKPVKRDGEIDRYEFSANLLDLFRTHAEASRALGRGEEPYNNRRLGELLADDKKPDFQALAAYLRDEYELLIGPVHRKIVDLAKRWDESGAATQRESDMGRGDRIILERLLNDALDQGIRPISTDVSKAMSKLLKRTSKRIDFYNANVAAYKLLSCQPRVHAVLAILSGLMSEDELAEIDALGAYGDKTGWYLEKQNHWEVRLEAVKALEPFVVHNRDRLVPARATKLALRAIKWIAEEDNDTSKPREEAQLILERLGM